MRLKLNEWPAGTEDYVNNRVLNDYIGDTARKTGVHKRTLYHTRVEKIEKNGVKWDVKTSTLPVRGNAGMIERRWVRAA